MQNPTWIERVAKFVVVEGNERALEILRYRGVAPQNVTDQMMRAAMRGQKAS
jgi:hypothetical protein